MNYRFCKEQRGYRMVGLAGVEPTSPERGTRGPLEGNPNGSASNPGTLSVWTTGPAVVQLPSTAFSNIEACGLWLLDHGSTRFHIFSAHLCPTRPAPITSMPRIFVAPTILSPRQFKLLER
jgi:hypothetical protein